MSGAGLLTDALRPALRDGRRGGWRRSGLLTRGGPTLLAALLGVAVAFPLMQRGWFLTLDWVGGPHPGLSPSFYGFSLPASPISWLQQMIQAVVGDATFLWLVIPVVFAVGGAAIASLVGEGPAERSAAAVLFMVNPFVFERLAAGQLYFLCGYALLPLAVRALMRPWAGRHWTANLSAAWWIAIAVAFSVQYLWILGVVALAVVVSNRRLTTLLWTAANFLLAMALNLYLATPLLGPHTIGVSVGSADLSSYRTAGDPLLGLYGNVLGLYGFWRSGVVLPKAWVAGWWIFALVILMVAGYGALGAWRAGRRQVVAVVGLSAIIGFFLSLGDQGPTAGLFKALYFHLPFFNVMRESEKFSSLLALAYAVGFGLGVGELIRSGAGERARRIFTVIVFALPFCSTPTMFGALAGQLSVSQFPASWGQANRLMGPGEGKILFLPWHEYMSFPFTGEAVIANPASAYFSRPVISGDNVEVGRLESDSTSRQSAYLEYLFSQGPQLHQFGHLIAQLGVTYVVLAHSVDYGNYSWLSSQADLRPVLQDGDLTVWRNLAALPGGIRVTQWRYVDSMAAYVVAAQQADLRSEAVAIRPADPHPGVRVPPPVRPGLDRVSPTDYTASAGPAGWAVLPQPWSSGWRSQLGSASDLVNGVAAVPVGPKRTSVTFQTAEYVRAGYLLAGLVAVLLLLVQGYGIVTDVVRRRARTVE